MPPFLVCKGNFFIEDRMAQVVSLQCCSGRKLALEYPWIKPCFFKEGHFWLSHFLIRGQKACPCKDYPKFK